MDVQDLEGETGRESEIENRRSEEERGESGRNETDEGMVEARMK